MTAILLFYPNFDTPDEQEISQVEVWIRLMLPKIRDILFLW